jgi:hypothetical protein
MNVTILNTTRGIYYYVPSTYDIYYCAMQKQDLLLQIKALQLIIVFLLAFIIMGYLPKKLKVKQ